MDQLKEQLAVVLKYGFWITTAIILLGAIAVWYMVTGDLIAENEDRTRKIEGYVQQVNNVRMELSSHPNQKSHDEMQNLIEARQEEVLEAWRTSFDRQREILVWPRKELQKELVDEYEDLIPIEAFIDYPPTEDQEVESTFRNSYARYIGNTLPDIAKIAKTEWVAKMDKSNSSMMSMGEMGMSPEMAMAQNEVGITGAKKGPLVKWPVAAQESLIRELFPWWPGQPSTLDVYYSQENLWILKQLLGIIADVNDDAKQAFEAKIHQINRLSMGRKVRFGAGQIAQPGMTTMAGMMGMESMGMMEEEAMMMEAMGGMGDMSGGMLEMELSDPADNRYVDTQMEPIDGARLRSAFASTSPEDAPLKVAKRVPVMMSLQIDQRAVPELIAACGSARLMVEVKQARMLPKSAGANAASGAGMDMGMGMGMGDMGMSDMGMGDMGMSEMGMGMGSGMPNEPKDPFPLDVTVEIYGLIHIYNPPEEDKLGVEQVTAETVLDGESMGENVDDANAPLTVESTDDADMPEPTDPQAEQPEPTNDLDMPATENDPNDADPAPSVPAEPSVETEQPESTIAVP